MAVMHHPTASRACASFLFFDFRPLIPKFTGQKPLTSMNRNLPYAITFFLLSLWNNCGLFAQQDRSVRNETRLLHNAERLIPLQRLDEHKIAVFTPSGGKYADFVETLQRYADVRRFDLGKDDEDAKHYSTVIVAGTENDLSDERLRMAAQSAANRKKVVLVRFLADENRSDVPSKWLKPSAELAIPGFSARAQRMAAMSVFGGLAITQGKHKTVRTRLQYPIGDENPSYMAKMTKKIDSIAAEAIHEKGAPGMVVMAVKDGRVIFDKAYGTHTYADGSAPMRTDDIFDLASISKIAGTTPVVMHLQERGSIALDGTIGDYLWQAKNGNKKDITLRSVLLHEAGFMPFIRFYESLAPGDLQRFPDDKHQVKVADSAYLRNHYYRDVMWPQMLESAVKPVGNYVYSDISMYVMKEIADRQTGVPMDEYVQRLLYRPLGMKTAGYNPRERFPRERIVPTQRDTAFRKVLLQGHVHDEGAAMAGGVAGHAGLFASANDLAIYAQMLLNRGRYGGRRYFRPETVDLFTSKQSRTSRRGLGFDRADPAEAYPSELVNESVYGHTGYTGTCIWIDPQNQLTYIFLSNRVHPQVTGKIYKLNTRARILDVIYEAIGDL